MACKTDYTIHDKTICIIFWNCYLSFRQVNKTIRDNSLMQMKRVTTMKGILIWNCNSIRYLIQTMGSRTKFFLEILATLASWCKNLKISYSSFCMQLHLLFWSVCISHFIIRSSNNPYFMNNIINKSQATRISNIKYV